MYKNRLNYQSNILIIAIALAFLCKPSLVIAQPKDEHLKCDSLYNLNRDIFIESYYFSKVFHYDLSQRNIERFFNRDNEKLDLESLDSLLRSGVTSQVICQNLNAKQFNVLCKFYRKDYELDNYIGSHQIEFETLMKFLYHNKSYRKLVTKYFRTSKQTTDSLSETQMRVIQYEFVCYLILHNINVKSLNIR